MLGEDTLVFTRKGFKKVSEVDIYDEVLTSFGDFEPIVAMSKWERMEKCVFLGTGDKIYCSDDLFWWTNSGCKPKCTDELRKDGETCASTDEISGVGKNKLYPAYEFAVVVPTHIPYQYLIAPIRIRLDFIAGLIVSPICEVGNADGKYSFYTKYYNLGYDIVSLLRSVGWYVNVKFIDGVMVIDTLITSHFDEINVKDPLKKTFCSKNNRNIKINKVLDVSEHENVLGRRISVLGGNLVVGYGFLPVE